MGGENDIGATQKRVSSHQRLFHKNIKRRPGEVARGESLGHGLFVVDASPGAIDDSGPLGKQGDPPGVEQVCRFRS